MTKHFRPFFISAVFFVYAVFFVSAVGRVCFGNWMYFTAGQGFVLEFGVVIAELRHYTIIFYINIYLNGKYQQIKMNVGEYIINDYLKRILKCEI